MDHRLQRVIAQMKEHLHRGWPAGRFARLVNLSPSRLHQVFKEELGLPPAKYLRRLRMEQARELLESSYLSVKEVMARVGVLDESHFVRDFKKAYGLTPAKYREQFLRGRTGPDASAGPPRLSSAPAQADARAAAIHPTPPSSLTTPAAPPLLLRRVSHPRYFTSDPLVSAGTKNRREFLPLLLARHAAFAALTTAIGARIARSMAGLRPILYRARRSAASRRLPPAAERTQAAAALQPRATRDSD